MRKRTQDSKTNGFNMAMFSAAGLILGMPYAAP